MRADTHPASGALFCARSRRALALLVVGGSQPLECAGAARPRSRSAGGATSSDPDQILLNHRGTMGRVRALKVTTRTVP